MLEILPELMGQLMSVQTCFSRAVFRAMLSGCLHTPRHLQGVGDQFLWKESPEQCHPDICTLPDTSREWGTSCSGRNLQSNVIWMSAHSQTPPGSGGPVAPEGISGAMSSGCLDTPRHLPDTSREWGTSCSRRNLWSNVIQTSAHSQTPPRHLQGVRDQLLWKESLEQCHLDVCTLPEPLGSGGQVALEGISRAMSSGRLHTPRNLQGVGDKFLQTTPLEN